MKNDIWATFYHYGSTDDNPQHEKCHSEDESWYECQRALAALPNKTVKKKIKIPGFVHSYKPLPADVLKAIEPIYNDLSMDELLERCLAGSRKIVMKVTTSSSGNCPQNIFPEVLCQ